MEAYFRVEATPFERDRSGSLGERLLSGEGYTSDWVSPGSQPFVEYTNKPKKLQGVANEVSGDCKGFCD